MAEPKITDVPRVQRPLDAALIETLVREFAHGAGYRFDPAHQIGGQRESLSGLGFGQLYMALPSILGARRILVVGSGRGFSVACMALGAECDPGAQVWFVDPGLKEWDAGGRCDVAPGLWTSSATAIEHFRTHLGLDNVRHFLLRSDEAFAQFREEGVAFDLILIDGEHSFRQASKDLCNALEALRPGGLLLAHDARCSDWPGVALAVEQLAAENGDVRLIVIDPFPGMAIIQKRRPLLTLRLATVEENERINAWRAEGRVMPRPLAGGSDPRAGVAYDDPHEGLFAVLDGDELIGGFGFRRATFDGSGPDNFRADDGQARAGYLMYGTVLAPDRRGRGYWDLARCEVLRWTGDQGYYVITERKLRSGDKPYSAELVGRTPNFLAYHIGPRARRSFVRDESLMRENEQLRRGLARLTSSISWRVTAPVRAFLDWLRGLR